GVLAGLCGPLLLTLMNACHRGFVSLKLAPPWQLALGGLIVGLLSLFTPAVWGNIIVPNSTSAINKLPASGA
ncbi:chloride channel protein, partial [Escherichia sp. TWPC-MK]